MAELHTLHTLRCALRAAGLALAVLAGAATGAEPVRPMDADPQLEARVQRVAVELRCLVCQNETIAESMAPLAVDLRTQIRERLARGESEQHILDFMVQRYGDFVRYRPALQARTVLLWGGPFLLLAVALWAFWRQVARRRGASACVAEEATEAATEVVVEPSPNRTQATAEPLHPAVRGRVLHWGVALGTPLLAAGIYWQVGEPDTLLSGLGAAPALIDPHQAQDRVAQLQARLQTQGGSADDWSLLGRSRAALEQYPEAANAYARALALAPDSPQVLTDYADVLAAAQGFRIEGEPLQLVERALKIDADHPKALALAGAAAFERGEFAAAAVHWRRARTHAPPDGEFAQELAHSIERADMRAGAGVAPR
ncbi:MAG: cytochrome C biogenesis protein [Comamonadaceae bacterium]|nr:cytochrome C biogenesis protein [Comamonadaceae bacterium]